MKKILHIIYGLNAGGIETLVMTLYKNINREEVQFDFLVLCDKNEKQFYDDTVLELGGKIFKVSTGNASGSKKFIMDRWNIYKFLKESDYEVVHVHSGQIDKIIDLFSCWITHKSRIIVHSHNNGLHKNARFYKVRVALQKCVKNLYTVFATDFFTCSIAAAQWSFPKKVLKNNKLYIVKNGVDCERFSYNNEIRTVFRKKLGIGNELVFGHVGRFSFQKNHEFLIDIFYELHKNNPNSKLLLIGEGELVPHIKQKVNRLGISSDVIFLGTSNEVYNWLQAMDAFLLPSYYEGLPVVGIEAQAVGLPLYISDTITKELEVTENVSYISLEKSGQFWANYILRDIARFKRCNTTQQILKAGYDIKEVAKDLEKYYMEMKV